MDTSAAAALIAGAVPSRGGVLGVIPVQADSTRDIDLPGLTACGPDGMLLANARHFVRDPDRVLARLS